jgi:L,D-transpeptidase catalytic domain
MFLLRSLRSSWRFGLAVALLVAAFSTAQRASAGGYDPSVCQTNAPGGPLPQACLDLIAAYPTPFDVQKVEQDRFTLGNYSFWRVGPDAVNYFDGPGGNVIGQIPPGFNFVNIVDQSVEGWLKTQDGRWLQKSDAKFSEPSYFTGVSIGPENALKFPFAFVLDKSNIFTSETPGGPASRNTKRFLKRYEVVNIFATAQDKEGWRWYMIGPNQWVKQTFVGKVFKLDRPKGVSGRWVAIDLYEQTLVAYEDDRPVFATLISSGEPDFDTPEGLFKVWARLERDGMSGAAGAPEAYALQSVPWVLYFNEGISIHGTYWHDIFGYRTSHGCVNLTISDARWVFQWMKATPLDAKGEQTNFVFVHSSGVYGESVVRGQ